MAKSKSERLRPIHFINHDAINETRFDVGHQLLERRAIHVAASEAAIVIYGWQADPAFVGLGFDERFGTLPLGVEAVELLFKSFFGGFAGVDGTANLGSWLLACSFGLLLHKSEEVEAVQMHASNGFCHGGQRLVGGVVPAEAVGQHFDAVGLAFVGAGDDGAGLGRRVSRFSVVIAGAGEIRVPEHAGRLHSPVPWPAVWLVRSDRLRSGPVASRRCALPASRGCWRSLVAEDFGVHAPQVHSLASWQCCQLVRIVVVILGSPCSPRC